MRESCKAQWLQHTIPTLLWLFLINDLAFAQDRPQDGMVNVEYSRIYVFVDKVGVVGHQHAIEGKILTGNLLLRGASTGALTFDMKSFEADTSRARSYIGLAGVTDEATCKKVNENMRGAEILDVEKFSTARFENVSIQTKQTRSKRQLPEYLLTGNFSLHEKTRPIEIVCDLEVRDGWNHLRGGFKILQSDYGIKPFSKMLGTIGVTDELTIYGDLWIVPE